MKQSYLFLTGRKQSVIMARRSKTELTKVLIVSAKRWRFASLIALVGLSALIFIVFLQGAYISADTGTGSISLTTLGSPVNENFDTLSNTAGSTTNTTLPTGWYITETGGGARDNEQYAVDTGGSNTGDIYSYGAAASTERALGALRSGTLVPLYGAKFTNNTGSTIASLIVSYTGEEWRLGTAARTDQINFQISTDATDLNTGTYTAVPALNFVTPNTITVGAKDGNAAGNRTMLSATISSLSIANGASFFIRWTDTDATNADDGLAVDEFSITPQGGVVQPVLDIDDVTMTEGDSGTTVFNFTVSATSGTGTITFDIATQDNSATDADNDYEPKSLTGQTISPGGTYSFTVDVNGDTTPEPNETFFVNITNVSGATIGDGQGVGTINNDDVALTPIHDIQGPGASSPLSGSVSSRGVVTGVKSNGFFIQEPDATVDADPLTSEGIFVFTSSAPPAAAAVGNLVQVTGTISEFVPNADLLQPPLTELTSPTVVMISSGNPLPVPIPLGATFPDPAGVHDQLERLEGMRVSASSLTVFGPTLGNVNEPNATATSTGVFYGVITGVARPFRETGIQAPDPAPTGSIPPIPRFDSNPERIRVDSDGLTGGTLLDVRTGAVVTGLVGPLDYTFRTYTILPDPPPAMQPAVDNTNAITATPVTTPMGNEFTVASYNLERFFDTINDPGIGEPVLTAAAYNNRLNKASLGIRNFLKYPDILGVVEVENLTTLQDLANRISFDAIANSQPDPMYQAFLSEGNDVGGIDVGFLVKTAPVTGMTPRVTVNAVVQEGLNAMWTDPSDNMSHILNDRPPLRLDAVVNFSGGVSFPVTVIVNHLRSLIGVNSLAPDGLTTEGDRVRRKRQAQADFVANLVQTRQTNNPAERILLVGDFNAFEFNDGFGDSMGVIQGTPPPDNQTAVPADGVDLVNPDFTNLFDTAPANERYSFIFDGNAQSLDHIVVNQMLIANTLNRRVEHPRINADFTAIARNGVVSMEMNVERLADHDPIVGFFRVQIACTLTCPANVIVSNDKGQCGATVTYDPPTTSGDCTNVVCSPPSGSFFPIGTTTVTCADQPIMDNSGFKPAGTNPTGCSFTVTVNDDEDPVITCPANITREEQKPGKGVIVNYDPTTTDNTDSCMPPGTVTVVCAPPSGSNFPVGTTTVMCTATDPSNNTDDCSFTVTVNAGNNCVLTCPANISLPSENGQCGATVSYSPPTTTGDCGNVGCNPPSGSFFAVGTTTVTCTSDSGSNCSFTVTVTNSQPAISCPANITTSNTAGQCGTVVNYPAPTINPCFKLNVVCSPPSGSFFPVGTTTVTCTASDGTRMESCTFTVNVNDNQPPTITCPTGVTRVTPTPGGTSAVVIYSPPSANDNCNNVTVACSPPSGSAFPVGCTTVTCTATDTAGNTATCAFNVCVFNICLQDDTNPNNRILINTFTGDYRFCCGGITLSGKGKISGNYVLEHTAPDRRVLARANGTSGGGGSASLQMPPGTLKCTIIDRSSANNNNCTSCQ